MVCVHILKHYLCCFQHEQGGVTLLENTGNNGVVLVNGKNVKKNCNVLLKGGDEVLFSSCKHFSYVSCFQLSKHLILKVFIQTFQHL